MRSAYKKVLVAIDGSEASERVLDHVDALAAMHVSEVIDFRFVRRLTLVPPQSLSTTFPLCPLTTPLRS